MSDIEYWKSPIVSHRWDWIHLEMGSITWGAIQESHNFNTISHSMDENGRVALDDLQRKVLTHIFIKAVTVLSEIVSDGIQSYRAMSKKSQVFNKTVPFTSLQ